MCNLLSLNFGETLREKRKQLNLFLAARDWLVIVYYSTTAEGKIFQNSVSYNLVDSWNLPLKGTNKILIYLKDVGRGGAKSSREALNHLFQPER